MSPAGLVAPDIFSIIIPAYNEAAVIERCLTAILEDHQTGQF